MNDVYSCWVDFMNKIRNSNGKSTHVNVAPNKKKELTYLQAKPK